MIEPTSVLFVTVPRSAKERLREVSVAQERPMSAIVGEFLEPAIAAGWEKQGLSAVAGAYRLGAQISAVAVAAVAQQLKGASNVR